MTRSFPLRCVSAFSLLLVGSHSLGAAAFDLSLRDNNLRYWGQDSYGATHSDYVNFQQPISYYCQDDAIDVIPIAFVNDFFGTGNYPVLNLANTCNTTNAEYFNGTNLLDCSFLASDIEYCQNQGKAVTISLGGGGASVGFTDDSEAESFADQIWNLFLGGSSDYRPFGSVVLDGVDLDIEGGSETGYAAFNTQLRTHFTSADKSYYISGAPQCEYPDEYLGNALNSSWFDMVYVQFYNNPCGLQNFDEASGWDYGIWDIWAQQTSLNPNVKIFVGAPASTTAAGTGYQTPDALAEYAVTTRNSFPSFGGVMMWDASQAYQNDRYDLAIKKALVAAGGTGFTYPPCDAEEWQSGANYPGGTNVSYNGYIWESKYYASDEPTANYQGDWSPRSACSGGSASSTSTTSAASSTATAGTGNCASISTWSSGTAYTGGSQVTYNGNLWTAQWWTEGDTPGAGSAGVWVDDGACSSSAAVARDFPEPTPIARARSRLFRF
ncbi:class III chitinase [Fomitopsis serialis]|uniref:class III chitinase n=1 Tax=Fomitopsis serialis TaxID=139415 RepID=UPI002008408F|nr:class III chitinase [Neoantrodia serialis]KAH9937421.1 class III chitinase [Neoantrodia serialis]